MVQLHVPSTSLSRVGSIDDFGTSLLMPLGYMLAGPLASALGLHLAMAALRVVPLAASLSTLASRDVRHLGATPAATAAIAP